MEEKSIREAAIEGLETCPFCSYKEIVPPIEEYPEFQCRHPSCKKVSCRHCGSSSHNPISCDEHASQNGEHLIEEAMTAALVRECNNCGKAFVKEDGCNHITCPCGNMQCYICSESITRDYRHFRDGCILFDNTDQRHAREVHATEQAARRGRLARSNPHRGRWGRAEKMALSLDIRGM